MQQSIIMILNSNLINLKVTLDSIFKKVYSMIKSTFYALLHD